MCSDCDRLTIKIHVSMASAYKKAITNLARYKFSNFGYWAAEWVKLNQLCGCRHPNPFYELVMRARDQVVFDERKKNEAA